MKYIIYTYYNNIKIGFPSANLTVTKPYCIIIITDLAAAGTTTIQGPLLPKRDHVKRQKSKCVHHTILHIDYNMTSLLIASSVRVRKLTEEHPEVESLLKHKSSPTSTVELQDDIQKR